MSDLLQGPMGLSHQGRKLAKEVMRMPDGAIPGPEDTIEMPEAVGQTQVEVWDPQGIKHLMPSLNAHDMVMHCGWFRRAPPKTGPWAGAVTPSKPKVIVLTSKKNAPVVGEEQVETDLSAMSVEQLRAFAKKEFGMDFGPDVGADAILDAIVTEQQS